MENKEKNIHEGHRKRMFARYAETGFAGFSEHQIIEMLLFFAYPRKDQNERAHRLINHFGSISGLFNAKEDELRSAGITSGYALMLFKLISGLYSERFPKMQKGMYGTESSTREQFGSVLRALFRSTLLAVPERCFELALFFPNEISPFYTEIFGRGACSADDIELRGVITAAVTRNAASAAVARRCYERFPMPDSADIALVKKLDLIFSGLEITFSDYMIVSDDRIFSMRADYAGNIFG